jgi:hypothetical protein
MGKYDFRTTRTLLPDHVFAVVSNTRRHPTDLVAEDVWRGIIHLPDDAALMTSSHHGSQLSLLYTLRGDWVEAIGEEHDELFAAMLDAADCFQCSTFDSLHGFYRSALSNLRTALELIAAGTLGNVSPEDEAYLRWKSNHEGSSLTFPNCRARLSRCTKEPVRTLLFKQNGWMEALYRKLCAFTHSRPDSSDGEFWRSNGPIYVSSAFDLVFKLQASTYAACYILAEIARPKFQLPTTSHFLFEREGLLLWSDEITGTYRRLALVRHL